MNKNLMGAEQELYLAPLETIKNAEEIAKLSPDLKKFPFIIKYEPNEKDMITSELEKIGCTVSKHLDFANCVAVSMSSSQLKAIKTLECVQAVERDYDYKVLTNSSNEKEYISYLAGKAANKNTRKEIKLAVFDTGSSNSTVNFVDGTDSKEDENGHGTQMAEIISSVIADKENAVANPVVHSVIVADHRGFATTSSIMQALDWAINNEIKIISMSFGDYHKSNFLEKMIDRASKCGIIMLAAAGNDGGFKDENRIMYPAAFSNVLAVGAKNGDSVASYSSGGMNVDCFASGTFNVTDSKGYAVSMVGTSAATAFVAGAVLKKWCTNPESNEQDIIAEIKAEKALVQQNDNTAQTLTSLEENVTINNENSIQTFSLNTEDINSTNAASSDDGISLLCYDGDGEDDSSLNGMETAESLNFLYWNDGYINSPGGEVWYKFAANASDVHPNGSPGWYIAHTRGELDTIGYLYDSYGNQIAYNDDSDGLNFTIWAQLNYGETYYLRVKAYGGNTGGFDIRLSYFSDDHGNTISSATEVVGVYYEDQSFSGHLHSKGDIDYYSFVPARNSVMEIYTEGDTDTYGRLYCESGELLDSDDNSNGNGNFKITAHLEAMKRYYIAVSHASPTEYGDYTLRFKFIKDYYPQVMDEQYRVMFWYADNQDEYPEIGRSITRSKVYVSNKAKAEFEDRVILDEYNQKSGLRAVLDNGTFQDVLSYLLDLLISSIPLVGSSLSYAFNVGSIMYDFMYSLDIALYREKKHAIENTNQYIIGEHYWFTDYPGGWATGSHNIYSVGSGIYYGADYQRGEFIETYIKS